MWAAVSMEVNRTQPPPATERSARRKGCAGEAGLEMLAERFSRPRGDSSRLRTLLLGLGGAGGVLMIVSDFLTLYHVDVRVWMLPSWADPGLADACRHDGRRTLMDMRS